MTAPTLLILTAQPARAHVIMAITARLPLVHAPDLAMAYAARLTNNLNLWEQTPAWRLFPCTYFLLFGLLRAFPPLQRPIHRSFLLLLDFLRAFLCFNVQSATPLLPFWTSSVYSSASTSNPPLFSVPFGLPPCIPLLPTSNPPLNFFPFGLLLAFPLLQRPIPIYTLTFSSIANIFNC